MAKSKRTKITDFKRNTGNVFVSVPTPKPVQQVLQAHRYFSDWTDVANQIASATPTAVETPTAEPTTESDLAEIRIYAEDSFGKRKTLYTGHPTADTAVLCQAYANLAECRVECHDAVDSKVFFTENYPIPTLNDWVEVYNADTGDLIWVGLYHDGFDARCRKYADNTGHGLRVDSAHLSRSQFYTPRSEQIGYARENARHFARKHGVPIADAVGMIAITAVAWAAYVIGGLA